MIVVVVEHRAKPGALERALERIQRTGELISTQPGFVGRVVLHGLDEPLLVTTVNTWRDEESERAWNAARPPAPTGEDTPYVEPPSPTRYTQLA